MKKIVLLMTIAVLCLNIIACSKKSSVKTLGVSLLTQQHIFYQDLEKGLKDTAVKYNIKLLIQSADFDLATQTRQIEDFIVQKVDAIIVCPVDSSGVGAAIKKANEKKIPVFTADIAAAEGEVVAHIASDNVSGGRKAGEYLAKQINESGEIVIIDHPTVTSVQDRVKGFKEAIAKFPKIKIVDQPSADGQRDKAMAIMENVMQSHPKVKGVFAINDDSALGALAAINAAKKKSVIIVGYDAIPEARQAISTDTALKADVIQNPVKIGELTIETVNKYWAGETVEKVIPVEVGIFDKTSPQQ